MGLTVLEVVTNDSFNQCPSYNHDFMIWAQEILYMQFHGQSVLLDLDNLPPAFIRQLYKATVRSLDGLIRGSPTERALKNRVNMIRRYMRPHPLIQLAKCAD